MNAAVNKARKRYLTDQDYRAKVHYLFRRLKPFIESVAESNSLKLDKWYLDDPMWIVERILPRSSSSICLVATPDDSPGIAVMIDDCADLFGSIQGHAIHSQPHLVQPLLSRAVDEFMTCGAEKSEAITDCD